MKIPANLAAAVAFITLSLAGQASAVEISACLTPSGDLKDAVVGSTAVCSGNNQSITWNSEGPQGEDGDDGDQGPAGPKGEPGPAGGPPQLAILGTAGNFNGGQVGAMANDSCGSVFGPGARWADTKDMREIGITDPPTGGERGWVNFHPIGVITDDRIVDISGITGPLSRLACGATLTDLDGVTTHLPWFDGADSSNISGLTWFFTAGRPDLSACDQPFGVICVGPAEAN